MPGVIGLDFEVHGKVQGRVSTNPRLHYQYEYPIVNNINENHTLNQHILLLQVYSSGR
jgi:hypothetical protein